MRKVYVAGHSGMVGSAIVRQLERDSAVKLILRTSSMLDLTSQVSVNDFFAENEIDEVYFAAAKVGGIVANSTYPADFIYQNLVMECNVINAAHIAGVDRLLLLGSSCIYPKYSKQPISEDALLTGVLESTNEPYAVAKIAGIKLCESYNRQYGRDYRSVMPTNLYGPNDNFHLENSHVIPGLLRRIHEAKEIGAKEVVAWGTGEPKREFLYVDDMAEACVHVMSIDKDVYDNYTEPMLSHVNIGSGVDCTIRELVETIVNVVGYQGEIVFDTSKPDGTPRKLMDVSRLSKLNWEPTNSLKDGLEKTYDWFKENQNQFREK